jgi:hypothetical protein
MEDGERIGEILSQHLDLKPAREVATELEDMEKK